MVYGGARGVGGGINSSSTSRQPRPKDAGDEQFRKIFVGGLNLEVSTEGLKDYFAKYGDIVDCIVVKNPKTQRSKGFGFLTFKDTEAIDAVQQARPHVIEDKEVEVKRAMPRDEADKLESHVTTHKLFVGSLRNEIGESDLKGYFSQYGDVEQVEFAKHKETGDPRGFAFVTFSDYDSVDKAMLHRPHTIKEIQLDVRKGLSREEMQKVRMRQQQLQQQQHDYYGNNYYDNYGGGYANYDGNHHQGGGAPRWPPVGGRGGPGVGVGGGGGAFAYRPGPYAAGGPGFGAGANAGAGAGAGGGGVGYGGGYGGGRGGYGGGGGGYTGGYGGGGGYNRGGGGYGGGGGFRGTFRGRGAAASGGAMY